LRSVNWIVKCSSELLRGALQYPQADIEISLKNSFTDQTNFKNFNGICSVRRDRPEKPEVDAATCSIFIILQVIKNLKNSISLGY